MTANVLVVQSRPGLLTDFSTGHTIGGQVTDHLATANTPLILGRVADGECWLVNRGPRILGVTYTIPGPDGTRRRVGPSADYLLPGQARQAGIGQGVWWHVREAG